jgi:hypothetical protein
MKRRRFLQLAASAAAGAVVQHSSASPVGRISQPPADVLSLAVGVRAPAAFDTSYDGFGSGSRSAVEPDQLLEMLLEKSGDGKYQWTIDGRSYPTMEPPLLQQGRRYRLRMMNATGRAHSVSLRHHSFELTRIHQVPVSGIFKDTLSLERYNVVEADVLMSRSGPLLLRYVNS